MSPVRLYNERFRHLRNLRIADHRESQAGKNGSQKSKIRGQKIQKSGAGHADSRPGRKQEGNVGRQGGPGQKADTDVGSNARCTFHGFSCPGCQTPARASQALVDPGHFHRAFRWLFRSRSTTGKQFGAGEHQFSTSGPREAPTHPDGGSQPTGKTAATEQYQSTGKPAAASQ